MNDFLIQLLALQQDGKDAISAPTNWGSDPLLNVETEVDIIIDKLKDSLLIEKDNIVATWHFFIGSPGNGKSASIGKLCKRLMKDKGCLILDETGTSLADIGPDIIPYALNVYEDGKKFPSVQIVQDASIVRNPFANTIDPSLELIDTMKIAFEKGISLIICTNRGILEKAYWDHKKTEFNSQPWFTILSELALAQPALNGEVVKARSFTLDGKKSVFKKIHVSYTHLDNYSLLLGNDIFSSLLKNAIDPSHWQPCNSCSVRDMCPYALNRDWLAIEKNFLYFINLLKRGEVLSGQIIVFREALALISFILAGCPKDYNKIHPCAWVAEAVNNQDFFSLAVRRIYMCLFSSSTPYGLDGSTKIYRRQIESLRQIFKKMDKDLHFGYSTIMQVIKRPAPTTDVGLTRLFGSSGIFKDLDPCKDSLPADFYERWDSSYIAMSQNGDLMLTALEKKCIDVWNQIEELLENDFDYLASKEHCMLRRWSSNFLMHFGGLSEGLSSYSIELDAFIELLGLVKKPIAEQSVTEKKKILELNVKIDSLLNSLADRQKGSAIQLSESVTLSGDWVKDNLKPKIITNQGSGSVSLEISFNNSEHAVLGANIYLWLNRFSDGILDKRCFPQELLSGAEDARIRAASKSQYAFKNDNIILDTNIGSERTISITRIDGEVDIVDSVIFE